MVHPLKKYAIGALFTAATLLGPATYCSGVIPSQNALRVKFLGGDNEELRFDVKYNSRERGSLKLLILDDQGEPLYEDNYAREIDKKLTVPRLTDSEHVIFVLRSSKEKEVISYRVRITTRVVDDAMAQR